VLSTKRHSATGGVNEARKSNIMVDGKPATQFISSVGRVLEHSFDLSPKNWTGS
jgi:hypothetical protein